MANNLLPKPLDPDWDEATLLRELALAVNRIIEYLNLPEPR